VIYWRRVLYITVHCSCLLEIRRSPTDPKKISTNDRLYIKRGEGKGGGGDVWRLYPKKPSKWTIYYMRVPLGCVWLQHYSLHCEGPPRMCLTFTVPLYSILEPTIRGPTSRMCLTSTLQPTMRGSPPPYRMCLISTLQPVMRGSHPWDVSDIHTRPTACNARVPPLGCVWHPSTLQMYP